MCRNSKGRELGRPRPDHARSLVSRHGGIPELLQVVEYEQMYCDSAPAESNARWRNFPIGREGSSALQVDVHTSIDQ